jgi:hypothetical protein
MRTASLICGILAIGLLGYAGYRFAVDRDTPPGQAITIDEPERDLGSLPSETTIPVRFRIANASSQPIRVLGLAPC